MMKVMEKHVERTHAKRQRRQAEGMDFKSIVEAELSDLHRALNKERAERGKPPIEMSEVLRIDATCAGHVDYALKLGIRLQELMER
jgi:hypothetical protein